MSDLSGISRLQEEQEKTLKNCEEMIEKWEKFKEDYDAVGKLLTDLTKKTKHDVMVPVGPLAFMPGQLIHTNEIIVLLGDNWFAERSAIQATEIAKRRLKSVEDYLSNLHKEHQNILSHMAFTSDVVNMKAQNDFQEIKEELTEKDLERQDKKSRRLAHAKATKHSVKKVDLRKKPSGNQSKSKEDENLFARLEELERQEKINQELENEEHFGDTNWNNDSTNRHNNNTRALNTSTKNKAQDTLRAGSDTNACSNISNDGSEKRVHKTAAIGEKNDNSLAPTSNAHATQNKQNGIDDTWETVKEKNVSEKRTLVKRVSWKEKVEENEEDRVCSPKSETATIYFTHSAAKVTGDEQKEINEQKQNISSPADILTHYLNRKDTGQNTESDLKNSENQQENKPQVFSDVVVEHKDVPNTSATVEKDKEEKQDKRKISKFKASRMKNN